MKPKRQAALILLLNLCLATAGAVAQTPAARTGPTIPPQTKAQTAATPKAPATEPPSENTPVDVYPQVVMQQPAAPATEWSWHDRVQWASLVLLALMAYVGIMMGLRLLRAIESHTRAGASSAEAAQAAALSAQEAAKAALDSGAAALEQARALVRSERPWIVITVEPFLTMENRFKVMATNKGRSPAKIVAKLDETRIAADETTLPDAPQFTDPDVAGELAAPVILLPGESVGIRSFGRVDVPGYCPTPEQMLRIETWAEKIFLYGRLTYRDMIPAGEQQLHETDWCCRYIHGERQSALVVAGPPEYNKHS